MGFFQFAHPSMEQESIGNKLFGEGVFNYAEESVHIDKALNKDNFQKLLLSIVSLKKCDVKFVFAEIFVFENRFTAVNDCGEMSKYP